MVDTTNHYVPDYGIPPGETLLETIKYLGVSKTELAKCMECSKEVINEIIKGTEPITPDIAQQLELAVGIPASFWSNAERNYRQFLRSKIKDNT